MASDIRLVLSVDDRDLIRARKEQEKYQFRIAQVEKEFRKGNITAARYNKELANQARELAKLGGGYNKANSEIRKYAYGLRQATDDQLNLAQAMTKSGKGMRRMEILAQQAGYQIGDFAVQVQSGTNVMVALGQQGSQLLGFFGPTGAIAGAALAIGTGLLAPLLRAKGAAEETTAAIDELSKKINSLREERLEIQFGADPTLAKAAEKHQNTLSDIIEKQVEADTLEKEYGKAKAGTVAFLRKEVEELQKRYDKEVETYHILESRLRTEKQRLAEVKSQKEWEEGAEQRLLTLNENRFAVIMRQVAASKKAAEDKKKEEEAQSKLNQAAEEKLRVLGNEVALLAMIKQFGQESFAVQRLRNEIELENFEVAQKAAGHTGEMLQNLIDQKAAALGLKQEMSEIAALAQATLAFAPVPAVAAAMKKYAGRSVVSSKEPIFGDTGKSIYAKTPKGPKASTIEDTIKQLQRQADKEKQLVNLTGQKRREEELFIDLKNANADADIKTSETRLRTISQEISAMEERNRVIEAARQQQEALKGTIESSMEDAFMSIVDGTKTVEQAFKDMARQIIAELYRVLVVKRMVAAISNALPFADGGVFQGGSQVKAFASGGVVGGPTYFPMSGGKTGLMGEAGPEAIMPLKRGKDGKLGVAAEGGGGSVTINQTFAFQANGDDSVKKIIAQAAPKIAAMTQQQIMDSRRRGGQMKQVFG